MAFYSTGGRLKKNRLMKYFQKNKYQGSQDIFCPSFLDSLMKIHAQFE